MLCLYMRVNKFLITFTSLVMFHILKNNATLRMNHIIAIMINNTSILFVILFLNLLLVLLVPYFADSFTNLYNQILRHNS